MPISLKYLRLSVMMFLQYAAPGLYLPILSHYLKNQLLFTPFQVGLIMAMPAIAALISPFFATWWADRIIPSEKLLGLCHVLAGIVMVKLSWETAFLPFLIQYLIYGLLFAPTFALSNAVSFHHISDAKKEFGSIRMWGPISWVVVAFGFSFLWLHRQPENIAASRLSHALVLSGVISIFLGFYSFGLPTAVHAVQSHRSLFSTLRVFANRNLVILCLITLLNSAIHQFYYYGMSPFLHQLGLPNRYIMPAMSLGQLGEIFTMACLGIVLTRFGIKKTLLIGILAQAFRCVIFALGNVPLTILVIPIHGVCYAFYFATAFIYVDLCSTRETRAGAQQLFNLLISGAGTLLGNLSAGKLAGFFNAPETGLINFSKFWSVSGLTASILAMIVLLFVHEQKSRVSDYER